jgi:hypothetical protein
MAVLLSILSRAKYIICRTKVMLAYPRTLSLSSSMKVEETAMSCLRREASVEVYRLGTP